MNIKFVRDSASNTEFKVFFESSTRNDIIQNLKCFDEVTLDVIKCKENLSVLIYMYNKVESLFRLFNILGRRIYR